MTAYREQTYVERSAERCYCDEPVARRCRCCRRPRCRAHLTRGLCSRCGQAVARGAAGRTSVAWIVGIGVGAALLFACVAAGMLVAAGPAVAAAAVAAVGSHRALTARAVRRLRPMLATTVGELPGPARDFEPFPSAPPPRNLH